MPDTVPLVTTVVVFGLVALGIGVQWAVDPTVRPATVMTTASVGAGLVTALFALWLNHRRYRLDEARQRTEWERVDLERQRRQLERRTVELECAKDRREHNKVADDAVAQVVELFGHLEDLVRAGALHQLAGLVARRPDRAEEAARLVCMYLRMMKPGDAAGREAQTVLASVVRQANTAMPSVKDVDLDLTGATLTGFALEDVSVGALTLSDARLSGTTSLRGLRASRSVELDHAVFGGHVQLYGARLRRLSAKYATFAGDLSVASSEVERDLVLSEATVSGTADLSRARIGTLDANGLAVAGDTHLRRATVSGSAHFLQARLGCVDLEGFASGAVAVFDDAHFTGALRLPTNGSFAGYSLRRTTVATDLGDLPPPWRIVTADGVRHLTRSE